MNVHQAFLECYRKFERVLEQKNSYKIILVSGIVCAIMSALCAVLLGKGLAVMFAVLMLVMFVLASWSIIFNVKRHQMDEMLSMHNGASGYVPLPVVII